MTIERPGISRRSLLTTTAVGVPAMGLLGAANLFGAATANAVPPVTIDGYWGPQTTTAFQWLFGTVQDGVVSSQLASQSAPNTGLAGGWEWVADTNAEGSAVIRAIQENLRIPVDGLIGPTTINAIQAHESQPQTGVLKAGSQTIKIVQQMLSYGRF